MQFIAGMIIAYLLYLFLLILIGLISNLLAEHQLCSCNISKLHLLFPDLACLEELFSQRHVSLAKIRGLLDKAFEMSLT